LQVREHRLHLLTPRPHGAVSPSKRGILSVKSLVGFRAHEAISRTLLHRDKQRSNSIDPKLIALKSRCYIWQFIIKYTVQQERKKQENKYNSFNFALDLMADCGLIFIRRLV
jgi:hypothetical protein